MRNFNAKLLNTKISLPLILEASFSESENEVKLEIPINFFLLESAKSMSFVSIIFGISFDDTEA